MNRAERRAAVRISKHKPSIERAARVPTMIAMAVTPELGISLRMAISGIEQGWAARAQFDTLVECCKLLAHGASRKNKHDTEANKVAELGAVALNSIRERFISCHRMGATGEELAALRAMVDYSEDWWSRQGGTALYEAYTAMQQSEAVQEAA